MIKKIICIIVILASIFGVYGIVHRKTYFGENVFLVRYYKINDIISLNKNNLYEMADDLIKSSISKFKKEFPWEIDIQIKPLVKKVDSSYLLWDRKHNDKLRIIFYEQNRVICTAQINICFLAYMFYDGMIPETFDQLINNNKVFGKLKRNEKRYSSGFFCLTGCDFKASPQSYSNICTKNEYLSIYNAAMIHYYLSFFLIAKLKIMNLHPNIEIKINPISEKILNMFLEKKIPWQTAFQDYHYKKHWLRYELLYYRKLLIFLLLIVIIIFSFIQFFRKDLKRIIKEELAKNGVTLTTGLVYKIFWQNWKCLFYQARDSEVQAKIKLIAEKIADDICNKNMIRRAKELWEVFEQSGLPEQRKKELFGNYKKAIGKKTSFQNRDNAVKILSNHLFLLSEDNEEKKEVKNNQKIVKSTKKERGISEKQRLYAQIHSLIKIQQTILDELSPKNLYHLILAIEILPQIDSLALDKLFEIGVKKMLLNHKFIAALYAEDRPIIKECLNFKRIVKAGNGNGEEKIAINNKLLAGKEVIIIGGHKAHRRRKKFIKWTYAFNADDVDYIPCSEYNKIDSVISSNIDLIIVVRPVDHLVRYKLKPVDNSRFIWVSHFSKKEYLKEVNSLLS